MKLQIVVGLFFVVSCTYATPIDYRWNIMPDGNGNVHLIDSASQIEEIEPTFIAERDTRFLLFTRANPTNGQVVTWTSASIQNSNFNSQWPVRFLIHGFNSGPGSSINTASTSAYIQRGNYNVIVVDWSSGASTINYVTARNRVPEVANVLARFINFIASNGFTQTNNIIIAGHSLGAHIAGLTGKRVTAGRINTIFGMDPAGPLFSLGSPNDRFAENDALYTEGIRTNAGDMGFSEPLAHADFYPNWGSAQPGCGVDVTGQCAHSRAHGLFAESINSNRFIARRCTNYQAITSRNCPTGNGVGVMGGDPHSFGLRGIFFLETNSNSPFARG